MQVLCVTTDADSFDVQCPCCRQRYVVYYSRFDAIERAQALETVRAALLEHHNLSPLASAHPADAFTVPAWDGPIHACAAALLSGAPISRSPQSKPRTLTLVGGQQRRVS